MMRNILTMTTNMITKIMSVITMITAQTKMQRWTDVELRNISTMTVTMMKMVVDNKYDYQNDVSDMIE